ncbi:MAG: 4-hydroxythreonine-4-phosphate dehydrogenase PdxA [Oscillatoriales cyanobacterium]|nr:MAG: 4-hydroxythreonine-4-phosphate dehydrogenase PdxA [Oscillatoriales cyanobacterium]
MSNPPPVPISLAISIGDPAGIGPEVALKALAHPPVAALQPVLVGSRSLLERTYQALRKISPHPIADPAACRILDLPLPGLIESQILPGVEQAVAGAAGFCWLEAALSAIQQGQFAGVVTAPINKAAWHAAGHNFPGQTELCAQAAKVDRFGMAFVGRSPHTGWVLRALLATTHIPFQQVPIALTPALLDRKLDLLVDTLAQDFGIDRPTIAIAGLNPHSGEGGQLGTEERDWLIPWLNQARDRYPNASLIGPMPPDTMWVGAGRAWFGPEIPAGLPDAYLALYHDQGLIPVKLMAFDRAVNTTIGLPFVRTSPDHGTAFDIAGQGIADPTSMIEAIHWAIALIATRSQSDRSDR